MTSPSAAIQRPDLGWAYSEFDLKAQMAGFKGMQVLTPLPTNLVSANFSKVDLEALLNDDRKTKRAPGSAYARGVWTFTRDSFSCQEMGLEEPLDEHDMNAFAYTGVMFEQIAADRALAGVLRDLESDIITDLQSTSTFTNSAVSNEWDDPANCTPVQDVLNAIELMRNVGGVMPNTICMSGRTFRDLQTSAEIIDRIKYHGGDDPKTVTTSALAALFQLEQVVIFDSLTNSAGQGKVASISDMWNSEYVGLYKVARSADPQEVGVGRTFQYTGDGGGVVVEQYRSNEIRAEVIRARLDVDPKVVHSAAGYLLSNIVT